MPPIFGGAMLLSMIASVACDRATLSDGMPERMDCTTCHGSEGNPAPPTGLDGSRDSSDVGVGAHQSHGQGGRIAAPVSCTECHLIPTDLLSHPDPMGGPARVVFGPKASGGGAQPSWDSASASCADTYCHGATLPEAETRLPPSWTRVDGSQASCTSCHGNPPGGAHSPSKDCESCHAAVVSPGGIIKNLALHIDGKVDVGDEATAHPEGYDNPTLHGPDTNLGFSDCRSCHGQQLEGTASVVGCDPCHQQGWRNDCTYCHGGSFELSGAPPRDLRGGIEPSSLGVGTHGLHITATIHPAYACTECHPPVTDVLTPGHLFDESPGRSEVVFADGISAEGQYGTAGCLSVYCHGNGNTPGAVASFLPGSGLDCQSCHPTATQSSGHSFHTMFGCETCHAEVVSDGATVIAPELHVNGSVSVAMSPGTWRASTRACAATPCHGQGDIGW